MRKMIVCAFIEAMVIILFGDISLGQRIQKPDPARHRVIRALEDIAGSEFLSLKSAEMRQDSSLNDEEYDRLKDFETRFTFSLLKNDNSLAYLLKIKNLNGLYVLKSASITRKKYLLSPDFLITEEN